MLKKIVAEKYYSGNIHSYMGCTRNYTLSEEIWNAATHCVDIFFQSILRRQLQESLFLGGVYCFWGSRRKEERLRRLGSGQSIRNKFLRWISFWYWGFGKIGNGVFVFLAWYRRAGGLDAGRRKAFQRHRRNLQQRAGVWRQFELVFARRRPKISARVWICTVFRNSRKPPRQPCSRVSCSAHPASNKTIAVGSICNLGKKRRILQ